MLIFSLLMHRNHKFEKFITTKIQTDDLQRVEVMTGDNVLMCDLRRENPHMIAC